MKKFIAILMAVIMVLSFAACAKDEPKVDEPSTDALAVEAESAEDAVADIDAIKAAGKMVVGITDYAPMDYPDENGEWTGFDAEFATAFAKELGVEVEFIEIDWDNKFFELESKKIDCIWNGMTITDEVLLNTSCSDAYVKNGQNVVVKAEVADKYATEDSLAELTFAVEAGSAGEKIAIEKGYDYVSVTTQADTLMEVKAGTADACIIDSTMANAMTGEGTSYADLTSTVVLNEEEYGVGFRKGSDLTAALNDFMAANKDAVLVPLAEKYDLTLAF